VVVDEIGYVPFDPEAAKLMFHLVSSRYERASLIVTSNKPFSAWGEVFGDDVVATAMVDRLVHHAEILSLKGDSSGSVGRNSALPEVACGPRTDRAEARPRARTPAASPMDDRSRRRPSERHAAATDRATRYPNLTDGSLFKRRGVNFRSLTTWLPLSTTGAVRGELGSRARANHRKGTARRDT